MGIVVLVVLAGVVGYALILGTIASYVLKAAEVGDTTVPVLAGFVGALLVAASHLTFDRALNRYRQLKFKEFADRHGFDFLGDDPALEEVPFRLGSVGTAPTTHWTRADHKHVVSGQWQGADARALWCEWNETESHGARADDIIKTNICGMAATDASLPGIELHREGFLSRLGKKVGFKDIEVGAKQFDDAFRVKSQDPELARELLDPGMQQWLLGAADDISYEVADGWILARCKDARVRTRVRRIPELLDAATGIRERIPKQLIKRHPVDSTG